MNFKDLFNNIFSYKYEPNYDFSLLDNNLPQDITFSQQKVKVFQNLNKNIEYMKIKYNIMINSDIILRQFTINARGKQYNAFLIYIDGMVDSQIMDDFILQPLMLRNKNNLCDGTQNKIISETLNNNITIRKVKKFDLPNYLIGCLLPQNSIKEISYFDEATNGINSRKLCLIY